MRTKLTPAYVLDAPAPSGKDREVYWDATMPGFGLVVTKAGSRSYVFQYRNSLHQSRRMTWKARVDGSKAGLTLDQARSEAKKVAGDVEKDIDPLQRKQDERQKADEARRKEEAAATTTVQAVCEDFLMREGSMTRDATGQATFAADRTLRSAPERLDFFERLLWPDPIAGMQIADVKRSQINDLLDKIEDERGPQTAQKLLAFFSRVCSWHASRCDDFVSPIVRGMTRVKIGERARERTLDDQEICDVLAALDTADVPACYPSLVRCLLYSGLRRNEAARAIWPELTHVSRNDFSGEVWTVPGARMKGKRDHAAPVTPAIAATMERPRDAKARPFVFSSTGGRRPFSGFSKAKVALDKAIAELRKKDDREPMPQWQLHDLRRTARSLMSRAGVRPDISERVLAHSIKGVEGTYDRYGYLPEKHDALTRLAALIERITSPVDNVTSLAERRAS